MFIPTNQEPGELGQDHSSSSSVHSTPEKFENGDGVLTLIMVPMSSNLIALEKFENSIFILRMSFWQAQLMIILVSSFKFFKFEESFQKAFFFIMD